MPARVGFDFEVKLGPRRERSPAGEETAMQILVIGDFSARSSRAVAAPGELARRKPLAVDIDSFDRVMARIAPRLALGREGASAIELQFASIDDFHPDSLYRRVAGFQRLRELRERMQDPGTFAAAAAEFGLRGGESDSDTLSRLVGLQSSAPPRSAELASLDALIAGVVAPHIVRDVPHQAVYLATLDAAIGDEMRAILQHPQFKALEALWRGAYWLASSLETDEQLRLYVLDASMAELAADMRAAQGNVESSNLYRVLAEPSAEEEPWSLVVGNFAFGLEPDELGILGHLGIVASRTGAPFLAGAKPELVGAASFATTPEPRDWAPPAGSTGELWNALRESPVAPWIWLAAPRALLRLPFGKSGEPIESFAFDELARGREHESYLWANGALACALLIGRAFSVRGWEMEPGDELEIDDLPAHVFEDDGEKRLQPCAEAALNDRAGEAMLEAGLIPLLSYRNRNAVRVMRFQSIAKPTQALRGPWR